MYNELKNAARILLPNRLVKRYEDLLRPMIAIAYRGRNFECNLCNYKLSRFVRLENGDLLCPRCGSLPRNRRLFDILKDRIAGKEVLHFSPAPPLKKALGKLPIKRYLTSDLSGEFPSDRQLDITRLDLPENSFDIIICYHILEHIEDDHAAMDELFRVLKPGGTCFVQTPFKEGDIYEAPSKTTPDERLKHFGQEDHVRIYSVNGLRERLRKHGFNTDVSIYEESTYNPSGFSEEEIVLVARKPL